MWRGHQELRQARASGVTTCFAYDWRQDNVEQAQEARTADRCDPQRLRRSRAARRHRRPQHGRPDRALLPALRHRSTCSTACRRDHAVRHETRAQADPARAHRTSARRRRCMRISLASRSASSACAPEVLATHAYRLPAVSASACKLADRRVRERIARRALRPGHVEALSLERSTTRRSRREFVPSTASTPTRISPRCRATSIIGWSARADSRGCCPRPSPPRRSATCCSVATAR